MLSILVARYIWGDATFADAVQALRGVPRRIWGCKTKTGAGARKGDGRYAGDTGADGERHGTGRLVYPHGGYYEGEWSRGKKHGKGVQVSPCGRQYSGLWKHGKKDGPGAFVFKNGTVLNICFQNGKPVDPERLASARALDDALASST